jgi:hypothetical protein
MRSAVCLRCKGRERSQVAAKGLRLRGGWGRDAVQAACGLLATLASVVLEAEHLAVARDGSPSLRPRVDVVGFHLLDLVLVTADRADSHPSCVHRPLLALAERPEVQAALFTVENVRVDTLLALDLVVGPVPPPGRGRRRKLSGTAPPDAAGRSGCA